MRLEVVWADIILGRQMATAVSPHARLMLMRKSSMVQSISFFFERAKRLLGLSWPPAVQPVPTVGWSTPVGSAVRYTPAV